MKLTFSLTPEELADASLEHAKQSGLFKRYVRTKIILFVIIGGIYLPILWTLTHDVLLIKISITVFALAFIFVICNKKYHARLLRKAYQKIYSRKENVHHLGNRTIKLDTKGVDTLDQTSKSHHQWAAFERWIETPNLFGLVMGMLIIVIPKRSFETKAQEKEALQLFKKHIPLQK